MNEQASMKSGRSLAGYPRTHRSRSGSPEQGGTGLAARMGLRPGAPATVRAAVRLMFAGAVLDAAAVITIALTRGAARTAVLASYSASAWHAVDLRLTEDMIAAPVVILAWLGLAWAIGRGRDWARFVFIAYFALITAGLIPAIVGSAWSYVGPVFAVGVALWLVGLAVLVLVFNPRSNRYFEQVAGRR
jgi:hypothetical protein